MKQVDITKTLEELEGQRWGEPVFNSGLVIRGLSRILCKLIYRELPRGGGVGLSSVNVDRPDPGKRQTVAAAFVPSF
ncbi:hypothetical protein, partial [Gorillibacterium sp. sgz5001074]|uniref:hypothetical protein n=1 Tax=Gorillibacterium sp. sgz5001074 TaxID=3446695 RepID=UPI003F666A6E